MCCERFSFKGIPVCCEESEFYEGFARIVSQPAITKHIQELEAAYQTRLFDRQGSRISLTESGNLLLEHCERILEDYKRLEYEMHLLHNEYTGGLKLGASTTIAQYVLPPLLASFIGKFPQVSLSLLNGNSREIEAALQEHRIDLGFVEGVFRLPNIRYTTFLEDELWQWCVQAVNWLWERR